MNSGGIRLCTNESGRDVPGTGSVKDGTCHDVASRSRTSGPAETLRALWRFAFLIGYTLAMIPGGLLKSAYAEDPDRFIAMCTSQWCDTLTRILGVEVTLSGMVPGDGVLVVSNHRSYIDIAVIGKYLHCSFLAKAELGRWPVLGWAATAARTVYVRRDSAESRKKSRETIRKKINAGISFVVFPEGTTSRTGLLPFKKGIFRTAAEADIAVVPVTVRYHNEDSSWVDDDTFIGHFVRTFGRKKLQVSVSFGPAFRGTDSEKLMHIVRDRIYKTLTQEEPGGPKAREITH